MAYIESWLLLSYSIQHDSFADFADFHNTGRIFIVYATSASNIKFVLKLTAFCIKIVIDEYLVSMWNKGIQSKHKCIL